MDITVKGKNLSVGDALRGHVQTSLEPAIAKYFDRALAATVMFSREAHLNRAEIAVHVGRGMIMQSKSAADEIYTAFDGAMDRMVKQLRRYKRRLRDHNKGPNPEEILFAQKYILSPWEGEEAPTASEGEPTIIAEMGTEISTLSVSDAVMRMDLSDRPILMFRNRGHGGLNVVYRRDDGNIGWIDPRGTREG